MHAVGVALHWLRCQSCSDKIVSTTCGRSPGSSRSAAMKVTGVSLLQACKKLHTFSNVPLTLPVGDTASVGISLGTAPGLRAFSRRTSTTPSLRAALNCWSLECGRATPVVALMKSAASLRFSVAPRRRVASMAPGDAASSPCANGVKHCSPAKGKACEEQGRGCWCVQPDSRDAFVTDTRRWSTKGVWMTHRVYMQVMHFFGPRQRLSSW